MLPTTMQAVEITAPGGPEVLEMRPRPVPTPGAAELLVKVAAAGVNRPDILQRRGLYPAPAGASDIPGLEVAGHVASLGPDVAGWREGDRVMALVSGGGYAEYCLAPAPQCLPVPAALDLAAAGGVPETFFTVWTNLFDRGRLTAGETLLVHGGTSGIGTTAIQMARCFGARVIATAGSAAKCRACVELGAERAFDRTTEDFVRGTREATGGRGADVILDMAGGDYLPRNVDALAEGGRLVQIALVRGPAAELDLRAVMQRRLTITGSTLRPRSVADKGAIAEALRRNVWPHLEAGRDPARRPRHVSPERGPRGSSRPGGEHPRGQDRSRGLEHRGKPHPSRHPCHSEPRTRSGLLALPPHGNVPLLGGRVGPGRRRGTGGAATRPRRGSGSHSDSRRGASSMASSPSSLALDPTSGPASSAKRTTRFRAGTPSPPRPCTRCWPEASPALAPIARSSPMASHSPSRSSSASVASTSASTGPRTCWADGPSARPRPSWRCASGGVGSAPVPRDGPASCGGSRPSRQSRPMVWDRTPPPRYSSRYSPPHRGEG